MNTFYFNTGCTPQNSPLLDGQVWRGGVKQIPFDADAPKNAIVMFLCDNPNLPESERPDVIVKEVFNTSMLSKYVYLSIPS